MANRFGAWSARGFRAGRNCVLCGRKMVLVGPAWDACAPCTRRGFAIASGIMAELASPGVRKPRMPVLPVVPIEPESEERKRLTRELNSAAFAES